MSARAPVASRSHRLLQLGILLFLLGLLVGFAVPSLANPRLGLASHLEGVMNGLFLVVLGLVWPKLIIDALLLSLALAMVGVCVITLWGLRVVTHKNAAS